MLIRAATLVLATMLGNSVAPGLLAQDPKGPVPEALFETLDWRLVGPFRGGRVAAVCGVQGARDTYYFGSTGGGVWKTTDAGKSWQNISDGTFGGSIGAVAVAPSNPDIVYVGAGEKTWRGNASSGDGMWKSVDAGKTWEFCGLADSRHISRIRIDAKNPDLVYAAVMGHMSGPNEERGVFRSRDGGKTWERVLFANDAAGAVDLCLSPDDGKILYATLWRVIRTPWSLESGGEGSGLWKSIDGGDTWEPLHGKKGLPTGTLGIAGIAVAPSRPQRVYAQIEAEAGGLFRSDDAGVTWQKQNDERALRQRAWYYTRLYVDPKDPDTVYALNVAFHKSTDGGKTFQTIRVPHGDNHDLWIDPQDPARMIEGNDGGACVSTDGGKQWTAEDNQPTAQFYRVTTDTALPYRIYGAQQDNSTVRIASRSRGAGIGNADWESTAGGESGWLAPDPKDPELVYGGSYGGYLQRLDHRQRLSRNVNIWPDNPLGAGAVEQRNRFQWNFPILFSRHQPNVLYASAQVLFRSSDEGQTWLPISSDLTRNDPSKLQSSGGPITKDNTGVEVYCTIFAVEEGRAPGTIWCGSDDGLLHVTRDGGTSWRNVTPPTLPEWTQINCIAHDPFEDGGCYVAATRYKLDDFRPYVFATSDYGATWREITGGLDPQWFVRCVRADPVKKGMLYCGTERTVWVSFDDGRRWQRLARGLPIVPVTDLVVRDGALIAATQGRAFWSYDGLEHVRQVSAEQALLPLHVFTPVTVTQYPGSDAAEAGRGRNPPKDLRVRFFVGGEAEVPVTERASVKVVDFDGDVVFERATDAEKDDNKFTVKRGMNEVVVTWKSEPPKVLDEIVLWSGKGGAPRAAPGDYPVTVTLGDQSATVIGRIAPDPRTTASTAELQERFRLARKCRDAVTRAHEAIESIRSLRSQMQTVTDRGDGEGKAKLEARRAEVAAALTKIEEALYQTKAKSSQDVLNFPIRLNDKLLGVLSAVDGAEFGPTVAQQAVAQELIAAIDAQIEALHTQKQDGIAAFNLLARELAIPHVK